MIQNRLERYAIPLRIGQQAEVINPQNDPRYKEYWMVYHRLMCRRGVTPDLAKAILRTNSTAIAALMVHQNEADSLVCGTFGQYLWHLKYVTEVLCTEERQPAGAMSMIILEGGPLFIADGHVHSEPTPEQIAITVLEAARQVRHFGLTPKVALCSQSTFGNLPTDPASRLRDALAILDRAPRDFEYEGEMPVNLALDPAVRERTFPESRLFGAANVLVFASSDTASAVRNTLRSAARGLEVGPILMGMDNKAHIVTPSVTARGLLNIAAVAGTPLLE